MDGMRRSGMSSGATGQLHGDAGITRLFARDYLILGDGSDSAYQGNLRPFSRAPGEFLRAMSLQSGGKPGSGRSRFAGAHALLQLPYPSALTRSPGKPTDHAAARRSRDNTN